MFPSGLWSSLTVVPALLSKVRSLIRLVNSWSNVSSLIHPTE